MSFLKGAFAIKEKGDLELEERLRVAEETGDYSYIKFSSVEGNKPNLYPETMHSGHDRFDLPHVPETIKDHIKMYGFVSGLSVYFTNKE